MSSKNIKERIDDLQVKGYELIQNQDQFCFGMDAVLLSSFAKVKAGEKAIDLGCGNGVIPILLEAKNKGVHYTGLEIQKDSADLAIRNVGHNKLADKIEIVEGDIKEATKIFGASSFSVVTTNPPYMIAEHGLRNENKYLEIARHEVLCKLEDIIRESAGLLKERGRFYMVHRPFRLAEIMSLMTQYRIEPKRMQLVHPYVDKEPNMVLIEGCKGGNKRLKIEKPLIVYNKDKSYTKALLEMYGE